MNVSKKFLCKGEKQADNFNYADRTDTSRKNGKQKGTQTISSNL